MPAHDRQISECAHAIKKSRLYDLLNWLNATGWFLIIGALFITHLAKPRMPGFFDRYYNVTKGFRPYWDPALIMVLFGTLFGGVIISAVGFAVNYYLDHAHSDKVLYRISFCFIGFLSLLGIILCLFYIE